MTDIISLEKIKAYLDGVDTKTLIKSMEDGFVAYSEQRTTIPPVGHLGFKQPPGDVHIKYGYIQRENEYIVKIASNFYDNPGNGLPSSNGTMLLFSQRTGELKAILLDEGYLTDIRTAIAGAVVAKYLAPNTVRAIGIVGTGTQARFQLQYLKDVLSCRKVYVYGRSEKALQTYIQDTRSLEFEILTTQDMDDITSNCNYIVTTTPSTEPLIKANKVRPGTHITAMGADTPGKQELDPHNLGLADLLVVDSIIQCSEYGEVAATFKQNLIKPENVTELGNLIKQGLRRKDDGQTTVAILTGVAVQDIQIARLIYDRSKVMKG